MKLPVDYRELSSGGRRKVREEYIKIQNGLCAYCGNPLNGEPREDVKNMEITRSLFPSTMFDWPVHLHHDHYSGMTIGAVHCHCNAVLWEYDGE